MLCLHIHLMDKNFTFKIMEEYFLFFFNFSMLLYKAIKMYKAGLYKESLVATLF